MLAGTLVRRVSLLGANQCPCDLREEGKLEYEERTITSWIFGTRYTLYQSQYH